MRPRSRRSTRTRIPVVVALALVAVLAPAAPSARNATAAEPDFPAYDARYHNLSEMVTDIKAVEAAHPGIVHVFSIGLSQEGRPIWAAKVSDNVALDEPEPEVLIDALHHAREHLSVEQALYLFHVLADDYATDPRVKALVDTREVWFIFALNPDGFEYDLSGKPYRAWRKNRQPNSGTSAIGTDLNRNYDYRWGCCRGSSGRASASTYRGPAPFSAPETRALRDFVQSRIVGGRQQIRVHVSLHTNGQRVLYPYGYTLASRPPDMSQDDHAAFVALAQAMADRNGYHPMQSSHLYVNDGNEMDWMYGRQRIFTFTLELYPVPQRTVWADSYPADEHIAAETARNREALLYLIGEAGCPYDVLGATKARLDCGPFFDDLEIARGWVVNPDGTDTATGGTWQRGDPEGTNSNGPKQLTTATSGRYAFVTGLRAGSTADSNDVDGGETTLRSPSITLPADPAALGSLSFRYTVAHGAASDVADGLEAYVESAVGERTLVFEARGGPVDVDGAWSTARVSLAGWAGQSVRIVFVARDVGRDSLVEAAVDDVRVERPPSQPPGAGPGGRSGPALRHGHEPRGQDAAVIPDGIEDDVVRHPRGETAHAHIARSGRPFGLEHG